MNKLSSDTKEQVHRVINGEIQPLWRCGECGRVYRIAENDSGQFYKVFLSEQESLAYVLTEAVREAACGDCWARGVNK